MELVDALDLGSSDLTCGGSSPSARTINKSLYHTPPDAGEDEVSNGSQMAGRQKGRAASRR
jgi:hypothetical protein